VKREELDRDGILFLQLADGRGWVFNRLPGFPPLCHPLAEGESGDEEDVLDIDEACSEALVKLQSRHAPDRGAFSEHSFVWNCTSPCGTQDEGEFQLIVETDSVFPQTLDCPDSYDITFSPRSFQVGASSNRVPVTPSQRQIFEGLELPELPEYPTMPGCSSSAPPEERKQHLKQTFRDFVLDLHTGMYLTQLTANHSYADIHCQLIEDMTSLRLDQSTGRIVEFPLSDISRLYHISVPVSADQIVVAEFVRRKLAFVFKEKLVSQRFQICMELLVHRARDKQAEDASGQDASAGGGSKNGDFSASFGLRQLSRASALPSSWPPRRGALDARSSPRPAAVATAADVDVGDRAQSSSKTSATAAPPRMAMAAALSAECRAEWHSGLAAEGRDIVDNGTRSKEPQPPETQRKVSEEDEVYENSPMVEI